MRLAELAGRHRGQDVYVCGTGPSMRCFPPEFLRDKVTIGLNQFWKYAATRPRGEGQVSPTTYSLTVHPELLQEYLAAARRPPTQWLVKPKAPMADLTLDDPRFYVFHAAEDWGLFARPVQDTLFQGRGVQQTALHLAAHLGARAVVLVGVDMCALGGDHHGHDQHVRFLGLPAADVYAEYRAWTRKARRLLREHHGIPVLTLSPFAGLDDAAADYRELCRELKLPPLPPPKDVSPYTRKRADL